MKNSIDKQDLNHFTEQSRRKNGYKAVTLTTSYIITDVDKINKFYYTTGASDLRLTLPAVASNLGRNIGAFKLDSGAGDIVIAGKVVGTTTQTINGALTTSVKGQYSKMILACNSTGWYKWSS